jgi:hypothetical protein
VATGRHTVNEPRPEWAGRQPMRHRHAPIQDLRLAVECLPRHTREAMLRGLDESRIICGAYVDGEGGECPMLAAHRRGGRTDLLAFARAWDRFTGAGAARRATVRELRVLRAHLEGSLSGEGAMGDSDLAAAIADHRALRERRRRAERPRPGDADRSSELRERAGWAWLRPFRRYDEWSRAVADAQAGADARREVQPV